MSALIVRSGAPRVGTVGADSAVPSRPARKNYGTTVEVMDGLSERERLRTPSDGLQDDQVIRTVAPAPVP
ncbi:MAG: hypothetical protein DME76_17135 [Verrucomicrobia bacterium]|nr:MAG: hypothetical protein DME76_17135 [Verrucomicrobiota bacterium]